MSYYPDTLRRIVAEGHQLGSHTYSHKRLTNLSEDEIQYEINATNEILKEITGIDANAVRPPYGSNNALVKANANAPIILWSIDTEDWKSRDANIIFEATVSEVQPGDIILLHDTYETSIQAVRQLVPYLKGEGYTFVTVKTLIEIKYGEVINGQVYRHAR